MDKNTHLKISYPLNLKPPVKTPTKLYTDQFHLQPVKNIHSKYKKLPKEDTKINLKETRRQTSSVILRSITRKIVHEQYSFLNLSRQVSHKQNWTAINDIKTNRVFANGDKKLIEVIIRPKVTKTQGIHQSDINSIYNKRFTTKKSQSTVSFQESFLKNQQAFKSFRGRQKDHKIYEIKTTESDKLSDKIFNSKYGFVSKEQIANCKRLIETLNMERKKPKDKRNKSPCRCLKLEGGRDCTVADCPFLKVNNNEPQRPQNSNNHKSRITVVGRLGQADTEKYYLQYSTTARDNKTISTKQYVNTSVQDQQSIVRPQRDSTVQTDYCCATATCVSRFPQEVVKNRLISQATQVNIMTSNHQNKLQKSNDGIKASQCICTNTSCDTKENVLKECQSPLVVISVYPRQDLVNANIKSPTKTSPKKVSPQRSQPNDRETETVKAQSAERNRPSSKMRRRDHGYIKSPKSRTPSPSPKDVVKNYTVNKTTLNKTNKTKATTGKTVLHHQIQQIRPKEIEGIDQILNNCNCSSFMPVKENNGFVKENMSKPCKTKSPNRNDVKKALVDDFLNNIATKDDNLTNYFLHIPKDNASKVTINIDGKNDHYDVVLEKRRLDTDVFIKKATRNKKKKLKEKQNENNDLVDMDSMESYLMLLKEKERNANITNVTKNFCDPKTSSLNAQDSLELRHRRENRSVQLKTKQCNENDKESNVLANVKHYRGDDCSISDPNERDKEIRELLGILSGQKAERKEKIEKRYEPVNKKWTRDSCYLKCSKSLMTGHSLAKFVLKTKNKNDEMRDTPQGTNENTKSNPHRNKEISNATTRMSNKKQILTNHNNMLETFKEIQHTGCDIINMPQNLSKEQNIFSIDSKVFARDAQDKSQNLILNRNVQVFLQVEQFSKQKPIKLTKKQYDKLKKVIKSTISRKLSLEKRFRCTPTNCSIVSIGEVKVKPKRHRPKYYNREIQTETFTIDNDGIGNQTNSNDQNKMKFISKNYSTNLNLNNTSKSDVDVEKKHAKWNQISSRPTVSSMEIRFTNVSYMNHANISSTLCSGDGTHSNIINTQKDSKSIHAIFKGFKKTATPNLGTSVYSLYSDASAEYGMLKPTNNNAKPKKPFLRRLISCLVMRSNQISTLKVGAFQASPKLASANSSVDSYHISTSLGAFDMSSALYDTSASFYSNHTILPINKMKRSFFSSVRGFLRNRRGQT